MFQGSKNVAQDQHQSFIASIGGESNATTNEDSTKYWETVPAHYLPLALWLEADRMASLKVEESAFTRERSVVKEERRQRVDSPPYGRLAEIVYDATFTTHPYKHQVIGSMADLEAARIEDVRDFFETYYVPGERRAGHRRRLRPGGDDGAGAALFRPRAEGEEAGAARHPDRAAADRRAPPHRLRGRAAAGRRRRAPHHLRRPPGQLSAAHRQQGAVGRQQLADLPIARLREAAGAGRVRRRQHRRAPEPVLRDRGRPAGAVDRTPPSRR